RSKEANVCGQARRGPSDPRWLVEDLRRQRPDRYGPSDPPRRATGNPQSEKDPRCSALSARARHFRRGSSVTLRYLSPSGVKNRGIPRAGSIAPRGSESLYARFFQWRDVLALARASLGAPLALPQKTRT